MILSNWKASMSRAAEDCVYAILSDSPWTCIICGRIEGLGGSGRHPSKYVNCSGSFEASEVIAPGDPFPLDGLPADLRKSLDGAWVTSCESLPERGCLYTFDCPSRII